MPLSSIIVQGLYVFLQVQLAQLVLQDQQDLLAVTAGQVLLDQRVQREERDLQALRVAVEGRDQLVLPDLEASVEILDQLAPQADREQLDRPVNEAPLVQMEGQAPVAQLGQLGLLVQEAEQGAPERRAGTVLQEELVQLDVMDRQVPQDHLDVMEELEQPVKGVLLVTEGQVGQLDQLAQPALVVSSLRTSTLTLRCSLGNCAFMHV
jgi:hypothetical protein